MATHTHDAKRRNTSDRGSPFLTLGLDFTGWKCLVVGGGHIGTRKALTLLEHGAKVTVCSPRIDPGLRRAVEEKRLTWKRGGYTRARLRGVRLVVAATHDAALNLRISEDAEERGILCCIVSARTKTRVLFPATHTQDELTIAVHSQGRSPRHSVAVRDQIARWMDVFSQSSVTHLADPDKSKTPDAGCGKVYIIGAGPGAADLITVRALQAIRRSDLVIYDRILGRDFTEQLGLDAQRSHVEWLGAGRMGPRRQADINHRLLAAAVAGRTVARVKNGDPFVFGRGTEEIEFLCLHGVSCEIIPGVSSALGVLSAAGYAVTAREQGRSFAITSAQLAGGAFNETYPKADSVIVLMAVGSLEKVVDRLLADGWSPDTPALIIERGTQTGEREVAGRLREISRLAKERNIESPALLAVGVVASRKYGNSGSAPPADVGFVRQDGDHVNTNQYH